MVYAFIIILLTPIRFLKYGYGRRAKSFFWYGLEEITDVLSNPFKKEKFSIFIFSGNPYTIHYIIAITVCHWFYSRHKSNSQYYRELMLQYE